MVLNGEKNESKKLSYFLTFNKSNIAGSLLSVYSGNSSQYFLRMYKFYFNRSISNKSVGDFSCELSTNRR